VCHFHSTFFSKLKCSKTKKTTTCDNDDCDTIFIDDNNSTDIYCEDCTNKYIKSCSCCNSIKFCKNNENLCLDCLFNKKYDLLNKYCIYCENKFSVRQDEKKWRNSCNDCYNNNCISIKCCDCTREITKLKTQKWKIRCKFCNDRKTLTNPN
jgi:hypothetical protein